MCEKEECNNCKSEVKPSGEESFDLKMALKMAELAGKYAGELEYLKLENEELKKKLALLDSANKKEPEPMKRPCGSCPECSALISTLIIDGGVFRCPICNGGVDPEWFLKFTCRRDALSRGEE